MADQGNSQASIRWSARQRWLMLLYMRADLTPAQKITGSAIVWHENAIDGLICPGMATIAAETCQFARKDGCNDKLVRKAIKQKKLTPYEDGSLDPGLIGTAWRRENRRAPSADKGADMSAPVRSVRAVTVGSRQTVEKSATEASDPSEPDADALTDFIEKVQRGELAVRWPSG